MGLGQKVKQYKGIEKSKRCNFNNDLGALKTIFNWYKNNYDPSFFNPVPPRHKDMGVLRAKKELNRKMKPRDVLKFFDSMKGMWRDLAVTQFYLAARIQEVAGLQVSSVNFQDRAILIKDVVVWNRSKKFQELKNVTKNGDVRYVYLNDVLKDCLERRLEKLHPDSGYMFHIDGKPLEYRKIQYEYNKALKSCGLYPEFRSTHIMRHSMGTITRMVTGKLDSAQAVTGKLDSAQAVTGHKDIRLVQHYANLPSEANRDAVSEVEDFLKKLEKVS